MSKVSVVLTSYNRTTLLRAAIDSVINQTHHDMEFFIIDDGSPIETRNIIEEYARKYAYIRYIQTEKKDEDRRKVCDYAQNINTCAKQATGNYICYLTCDDIYYPNHVEALSKALDDDSSKMIVFGDQKIVRYHDDTHQITDIGMRALPMVVPQAACLVDHNMVMHRIECFDKAGYWIEDASVYRAGDAAFWAELNKYWPFYRVPVTTCEHRYHKQSVQSL